MVFALKGKKALALLVCVACLVSVAACAPIYKNPKASVQERVSDLLSRMTLDEKLGQMLQVGRDYLLKPADLGTYGLGSVLSGGGGSPTVNTPEAWADMIDAYQKEALKSRLGIPILYGVDAVHGHNNVAGAVIFPHNIGLGATRSPDTVRAAARVTAQEMLATGAQWDFAPCIAVPQDPRWGRTYEGFGSDPGLVAEMGAAAIQGYQQGGLGSPGTVLATAKHFVADGGTGGGVDRGDAQISEDVLRSVHLAPYASAVTSGIMSVMASFSSINGQQNHGNKDLLTGVLRNELGFPGFVVSDWGGTRLLPGDPAQQIATAVNAGIDMLMLPDMYVQTLKMMRGLVQAKTVSASRVDQAVGRILTVKVQMGLFEHPFADRSLLTEVGSRAHREVAREAVQKSLVLLKNGANVLPIGPQVKSILVTGPLADDLGSQCGGWTISWQGSPGASTNGTTILQGIKDAAAERGVRVLESSDGTLPQDEKNVDLVVLVVGETPYAEGKGDTGDLTLSHADEAALEAATQIGAPVAMILVSGRPLVVTQELQRVQAFVAAWLPGSEGEGVADVLFGKAPFGGKLPMPWPRSSDGSQPPLFPFGAGLSK